MGRASFHGRALGRGDTDTSFPAIENSLLHLRSEEFSFTSSYKIEMEENEILMVPARAAMTAAAMILLRKLLILTTRTTQFEY